MESLGDCRRKIVLMSTKRKKLKELKSNWAFSEMTVTYKRVNVNDKPIQNEADAAEVFRELWDKDLILLQEQVWVLFLSSANKVIGYRMIGLGSVDNCTLDVRMIVSIALLSMASGVILAHNHPGGSKHPSPGDINATIQIKAALNLIGVRLLDHLIMAGSAYTSLRNIEIL
jgi:DNA repair protein RadC